MNESTTSPPAAPRQDAAGRPLETPTGVDTGTEAAEGATGAQGAARMTADTATDDGLDWLYAELARARADATNLLAANGALRDACARWRAERDAERADSQRMADLVTASERTRQLHVADADRYEAQLRADLAEARAERDRARRVTVALEQQAAAVAALHIYNVDADYCELCADHGDIEWPCSTVHALNQEEAP